MIVGRLEGPDKGAEGRAMVSAARAICIIAMIGDDEFG